MYLLLPCHLSREDNIGLHGNMSETTIWQQEVDYIQIFHHIEEFS